MLAEVYNPFEGKDCIIFDIDQRFDIAEKLSAIDTLNNNINLQHIVFNVDNKNYHGRLYDCTQNIWKIIFDILSEIKPIKSLVMQHALFDLKNTNKLLNYIKKHHPTLNEFQIQHCFVGKKSTSNYNFCTYRPIKALTSYSDILLGINEFVKINEYNQRIKEVRLFDLLYAEWMYTDNIGNMPISDFFNKYVYQDISGDIS